MRGTSPTDGAMRRRPVRFVARVYCVWIVRYIDLPPEAGAAFAGRTPPVRGTCNGAPFRGTLVPRGKGQFRLCLNAEIRRAAGGVDEGDDVEITLARTRPHPVPDMPPELASALATHRGGRLAFEAMAPGRRRGMLRWLGEARSPGARGKRIRRLLEILGFA